MVEFTKSKIGNCVQGQEKEIKLLKKFINAYSRNISYTKESRLEIIKLWACQDGTYASSEYVPQYVPRSQCHILQVACIGVYL